MGGWVASSYVYLLSLSLPDICLVDSAHLLMPPPSLYSPSASDKTFSSPGSWITARYQRLRYTIAISHANNACSLTYHARARRQRATWRTWRVRPAPQQATLLTLNALTVAAFSLFVPLLLTQRAVSPLATRGNDVFKQLLYIVAS